MLKMLGLLAGKFLADRARDVGHGLSVDRVRVPVAGSRVIHVIRINQLLQFGWLTLLIRIGRLGLLRLGFQGVILPVLALLPLGFLVRLRLLERIGLRGRRGRL